MCRAVPELSGQGFNELLAGVMATGMPCSTCPPPPPKPCPWKKWLRTCCKPCSHRCWTPAPRGTYDFSVRPGRVHLLAWVAEGRPVLLVEDNGLGFDVERHRPVLFHLFWRFHDHPEGGGVGLYLVNRIAQGNGGRVEVESAVGKGTTFRVSGRLRTGPVQLLVRFLTHIPNGRRAERSEASRVG